MDRRRFLLTSLAGAFATPLTTAAPAGKTGGLMTDSASLAQVDDLA